MTEVSDSCDGSVRLLVSCFSKDLTSLTSSLLPVGSSSSSSRHLCELKRIKMVKSGETVFETTPCSVVDAVSDLLSLLFPSSSCRLSGGLCLFVGINFFYKFLNQTLNNYYHFIQRLPTKIRCFSWFHCRLSPAKPPRSS